MKDKDDGEHVALPIKGLKVYSHLEVFKDVKIGDKTANTCTTLWQNDMHKL